MKELMSLIAQGLKFFGISGIGWLIDFVIYNVLGILSIPYEVCNMCSSMCGVSFVFFVSTRNTFKLSIKRLTLMQKYAVYVVYQIIMILIASKCVGVLGEQLLKNDALIICRLAGIIAKICVTPFTMIANFVFMKFLSEKV